MICTLLAVAAGLDSGWRALDTPLLLQRPGIRQAKWKSRAANADIGAARTAFFPPITLAQQRGNRQRWIERFVFRSAHATRLLTRVFGANATAA
ncbi:hypothetical protein OZ429_05005 [Xanthomonas fragariae]|nr:hypothetical protein [Xanthomonas fragariae]WAT16677.1 hypothetical protein OZ429_05005 [Xanthomonas fragariae]